MVALLGILGDVVVLAGDSTGALSSVSILSLASTSGPVCPQAPSKTAPQIAAMRMPTIIMPQNELRRALYLAPATSPMAVDELQRIAKLSILPPNTLANGRHYERR